MGVMGKTYHVLRITYLCAVWLRWSWAMFLGYTPRG